MRKIDKKTALKTKDAYDGGNRITKIVRDDLPSKANRITSVIGLPPIRRSGVPKLFY